MDTKVIYCKGGKRNGFTPEDFQKPSDWENEYSEEDEVFAEDPRLDKAAATKPLMFPRQRPKVKGRGSFCRCRPFVHAIVCFLFLVLSLGSLMGLVVYFVNKHNSPNMVEKTNRQKLPTPEVDFSDIIGCDHVEVEDVWVKGYPKMLTESAFRLLDVNEDGVLDIIVGFATGADGYSIPSVVCDIYFNGTYPCFGGVLALEGRTGEELWRHYSPHEIYGLNCETDLNRDGVKDCLCGGRAGAFQALSGKDGKLLWNFGEQGAKNSIMNLYTAQITRDFDGDGIEDILAIHGGDPLQEPGSKYRLSGRIIFFSGRTGKVLKWSGVPDNRESYYSPQIYTMLDGSEIVLFGTGGETHGGSLWRITLDDLYYGRMEMAKAIYSDDFKGVMTPPVLADVTSDGVEDIILCTFNSSALAIDGRTYKIVWNQTFPSSESYNTPSPGFYNDDDIPDFLIKYAYGPGFPVYYHSITTILDGKTGDRLLDPPPRDTVGAQASGLTVSMEGRGNDLFLYWAADCQEHEGEGGEYTFVKGTNVHEQSRSDFCRLRFKTKGYSKIYAINKQLPAPGVTLYYSEDRLSVEHNAWINTTEEGINFVREHPEYLSEYEKFSNYDQFEDPKETETSPVFSKPGGEFLFDTPIPDEQRTSYKKGPLMDTFGSKYGNRGGLLGNERNLPYSDYDYDSTYYPDAYQAYRNGILKNNNFNRGFQNQFGVGRHFGYSRTTPRPHLERNRFRSRFPIGRSAKEKKSDKMAEKVNRRKNVKPIAMRKRRKRQVRETPNINYRKRTSSGMPKRVRYFQNSDFFHFNPPLSDENSVDVTGANKVQFNDIENSVFPGKPAEHAVKGFTTINSHKTLGSSSDNVGSTKTNENRNRKRRHVGPHDEDGLQRLLSTGSLAPTTLSPNDPNYNHSIDFVFATYWFYPAKTRAILPADQQCIAEKLSQETQRFDPKSKYFGLDHDSYEHSVTSECLQAGGHDLSEEGTYESQTQYNPFNIHMGQMTIYRLRLTCTCSTTVTVETKAGGNNKQCSRVLPFDQQQWFGYMGNRADSHWKPRKPFT